MDVKIENCLVGKPYVIHVKSGGPDCNSERVQRALDKARELGADVLLEAGVYKLDVPLRLPNDTQGVAQARLLRFQMMTKKTATIAAR